MSTSKDEQIDQLVQARWRAIGLSQADLAEILCIASAAADHGMNGAAKTNARRLTAIAELLGIGTIDPQGIAAPQADGIHGTGSLHALLELRMLRVFREVRSADTRRILIELAEQIVKRQPLPPGAD